MIYLDNSATTQPCAAALAAVVRTMETDFGNPSSLHAPGRQARQIMEEARRQLAAALGARPEEIFFTSGGTESDNMAILGAYESRKGKGRRVLTSSAEHPAVLEACKLLEARGAQVIYLPVDRFGAVDLAAFDGALDQETVLVTLMEGNNETGALNPISLIADRLAAMEQPPFFHVDGVQSFCKLPMRAGGPLPDALSLSAHKVHGPKGVGALYLKQGRTLPPLILGGGQEAGLRSGTENLPGLAGFGAAVAWHREQEGEGIAAMAGLKERLRQLILQEIDQVQINTPEESLPHILNVSFRGCKGEVLLRMLDAQGICVSTGSACAGKKRGSHVLTAMGLPPEEAEGTLRFSLSAQNRPEELETVVGVLADSVSRQRRLMQRGRRT